MSPELPGGLQGHPPSVCVPRPPVSPVLSRCSAAACRLLSTVSTFTDSWDQHGGHQLRWGSAGVHARSRARPQGWPQPSCRRGLAGLGLRASQHRSSNLVRPVRTRRGNRSSVVLVHPCPGVAPPEPAGFLLNEGQVAGLPTLRLRGLWPGALELRRSAGALCRLRGERPPTARGRRGGRSLGPARQAAGAKPRAWPRHRLGSRTEHACARSQLPYTSPLHQHSLCPGHSV